ncbi:hypothetical protein SO802_030519 [Lithocarpus litseifolius]|uniref:eRF1/Pelota-like N-terminal domain-containing protein n=1 Tax=Lithocarpus litseifolius TaxID=425828 RepID=A0AAW2BJ36_9ROSI
MQRNEIALLSFLPNMHIKLTNPINKNLFSFPLHIGESDSWSLLHTLNSIPGTVKIITEELDDLWLPYNLVLHGDSVTTTSSCKIHHDSGKITTAHVKLSLEITIIAVNYDKVSCTVRVQGKNITANEHVPTRSFHTLTLEKNKEFVLTKKVWDSVAVDTLREGCSMASSADLAVVLMQQQGLAHVFLVGKRVTMLCAKINGSTSSSSNFDKFFENVFRAFMKHVDFSTIRCVVIGSPGCVKDEFRVINLIRETNVVPEIRVFREFLDMVTSNSDHARYGPKSVETTHEMLAIETLLITDDHFRSAEIETRHEYVGLVKSVKKAGGKVFVFLSMHVSGEELAKLTGIAAMLRFPLPDLDR